MPTQFHLTPAHSNTDKLLSFTEEASFITSLGVGAGVGQKFIEMNPHLSNLGNGLLMASAIVLGGFVGRYAIPALMTYALSHDRSSITKEQVLLQHHNNEGRLKGWFAGAAIAALSYAAIPHVDFDTAVQNNNSADVAQLAIEETVPDIAEVEEKQGYSMTFPTFTPLSVIPSRLVLTNG